MTQVSIRLIAATLLLAGAAATHAQTAPSRSAPKAPGVTRAIERSDSSSRPDTSAPDPSVDQTHLDSRQPETATDTTPGESARDDRKLKPETATDSGKLAPETATDAPKPTSSQKAADVAREGVRSNTPPAHLPPTNVSPTNAAAANPPSTSTSSAAKPPQR